MDGRKKITWGIVALVVALIGVLIYRSIVLKDKQRIDDVELGTKQNAPQGELVEGFPKDLVEKDAAIEESYTINYDGAKQYTTNQTSEKSLSEVIAGYKKYFEEQKFLNITENKVSDTIVSVMGMSAEATYTVVVQKPDPNQKTYITINVLKR